MNVQAITTYMKGQLPEAPQTAVILGSGLGKFVTKMENKVAISYADIPDYPCSTVSGHASEWVFGYVNNKPIICASGRFHYYEGFSFEKVTLPVSVINSLGCKLLIITNAAGCLKKEWEIGDLMFITGYLDYTFREDSNPPTIVSFDREIEQHKKIIETASDATILLREGSYTWTLGPSYETPAEIRDIISLGGNAVGMSTVPEMMKARELELDVIGISCLTNYGAGMDGSKLSHEDVLETSSRVQGNLSKLLIEIV
jgi:purine-nucleoside phosphorylase